MAVIARGNPARWWKSRSCGGPSRAPGSMFISPWRRWISAVLLALLLALIGGAWYATNPARLSRLSAALLSRVLGGRVSVASARLSFSGTLLLKGVEMHADQPPAVSAMPLFSAEQIEARFDWAGLLSGQLTATQLVATRTVFRAIEDRATGRWNYETLRPDPGAVASGASPAEAMRRLSLPVVVLQDARVQWCEVGEGGLRQTGETLIQGQLMPDPSVPATYHWTFAAVPPDAAGAAADATGVSFAGTWNVADNHFIALTRDVVMSEALKRGMPRQVREWCDQYHLSGQIDQMKLTFTQDEGLVLAVDLHDVAMIPMIEPEQGIGMGQDRPAYPLPIRVSGSILFALDKPQIDLNLTGDVLGYRFTTAGTIHGFNADAPFDLKLDFPGAILGDTYPPLFMAFLTSQDLIQRIEPHGQVDISVTMARTQPRGATTFNGTIVCHDSRMRFAHFPFPLDHMNGTVTFDQRSVFFHDVTAMADECPVKIAGKVSTTWTNPAVDMTVSSDDVVFDDRLGACLPLKYAGVWDLFAIKAHGTFVCRVTRSGTWPSALFDYPRVVVDVTVDRAAGYLRPLPYQFSNARGRLHIDSDETRIDHLTLVTAADGSGRVTIDGVVRHPGGDVSRLQPDLHITADIPIDNWLRAALPEDMARRVRDAQLAGRLHYDGTVLADPIAGSAWDRPAGPPTAGPLKIAGNLLWTDGAFRKGDWKLAGINASAALSANAFNVRNLTATLPDLGDTKLSVSGTLKPDDWSGRLNLQIQGASVQLPAKSPAMFPKAWAGLWDTYHPSGKLDVDAAASVTIHPSDATPFQFDTYSARLVAHDLSVANAAWPEPLTAINGQIAFAPDKITMHDMTAKAQRLSLAWNGTYEIDSGRVALSGNAESKGFPQNWLGLLPQGLVKFLDTRKEDTTLKLTLAKLNRSASGKPWEYEGVLDSAGLGTTGALALDAQHASFTASGRYDPAGGAFSMNGAMAVTNLTVSSRRVDALTARITVSPEEQAIHIDEIDGQIGGGVLQGTVLVHTGSAPAATTSTTAAAAPSTAPIAPGGSYQAELMLHDVQLSSLLLPASATEDQRKKASTGMVSANFMIQETFGPMADRTGRGELEITDGNIYNVPLSMGLMQIATLRLPVAHSFSHASVSYYLRGDQITFERILLESGGINLAGAGTMDFDSKKINLGFLTETPHEVFIPIVSPIIQQTRNELLQLSVTGTADDPKIVPVPFNAISSALRALLPRPRPTPSLALPSGPGTH